MPWSREKSFTFHYFDYATIMKKMGFFVLLGRSFTMEISFYMNLHLPTALTTSLKFPNNILPVKNMCNLKNFLQWSLTYLLPKFWLLCHLINCTVLILKTENCHETKREKANNKRISKLFDEKEGIISKGNSCWYVMKYYGYCFS